MYDIPVLCSASAALSGNKPLLTHVSTNAMLFPLLLRAGWNPDTVKPFLDAGSFVPYFNGDRILLAGSKGKAWHWHKVYSSPTSRGFVKNKSCQTNLIFL